MSTFPIFIIKKHKVQFKSNYTAMTFLYAKINKREDVRIYVGGFKIPIALLLMCLLTLEGMLKYFGFGFVVSPKRMRDATMLNIPLNNGQYLVIQKKTDTVSRCILNGLIYLAKNYKFENIANSSEAYDCLRTITGKNKSEYIFKQIFKYMVDTQTANVLEARGYPTTLLELVHICINYATENVYEDKLDLANVYLRTTDTLVAGVEKGIHSAISLYKQKHVYQPKTQLAVDSTFIIKFFREQGVLQGLQQQNPTEEVSEYTSVRIVGPGGISNSDAVQASDRALRITHFGNIDPSDTSEGDPGTRLFVTSGGFYDDEQKMFMLMEPNKDNTYILGSSSSLTPFVERTDNARLQMAANQRRQAVPLINSESPMVCSGYESVIPTLTSSIFTKRAPNDCQVIYIDKSVIILQYQDGSKNAIDIRPAELPSGSGFSSAVTYTPLVNVGDNVKKGTLLVSNQFIKPSLTQGVNAMCAYLSYSGANYEDGYVISESFAKKLTSVHYDYIELALDNNDAVKIFPRIGQVFNEGEKIVQIARSLIVGSDIEDLDEVISPTKVTVVDIEIYPYPGFNAEPILRDINNYYNQTNAALIKCGLPKMFDASKFVTNSGKFKEHGTPLKKTKIVIKLIEYLEMSLGDKLTSRYAAKGVVTKILPDAMMPRTEHGIIMDILINPLSVISRMNTGQLAEHMLGNTLWTATNNLRQFVTTKSRSFIEDYLIKLYSMIDGSVDKTYSANIAKQLKSYNDNQFKIVMDSLCKNGLRVVVAPFRSPTIKSLLEAAKFVGANLECKFILPEYGNIKTINNVSWGILYYEKLEHMAEIKINARNIGKTVTTTLEPTRGKARQGGQRLGEFDTWCILSYGAKKLLNDFWLVSGDNKDIKNAIISQIYNTGRAEITSDMEIEKGGAGSLFDSILLGMGLDPRQ